MRPIDADSLKIKLKEIECVGGHEYWRAGAQAMIDELFPQIIDNEPTIKAEPVKHGTMQMADELIRLDTTIISIDSLINKASTAEEAKALFTVKDVIYSQQRYFTDVQPVDRWISIKDRLPEPNTWVMVYIKYPSPVFEIERGIQKMTNIKKMFYEGKSFYYDFGTITYWQPLPEPPKDGENT